MSTLKWTIKSTPNPQKEKPIYKTNLIINENMKIYRKTITKTMINTNKKLHHTYVIKNSVINLKNKQN